MIDKIKEIIRKRWFILLLLFVGVPALINWLFKLHPTVSFFSAEWDAGAALGFYGTILASFIAICGVFLSINYAQQNYREDEKNRQLPYLALTYMRKDSRFNLFDAAFSQERETDQSTADSFYNEYRLSRVYIVISSQGIEYKKKLDNRQETILQQGGLAWVNNGNSKVLRPHNYISLPFEAENVGNGAAIDFRLAFNRKDSAEHRAVSLFTLKREDKVYFHMFSELESDDLLGDYILELQYCDILGNRYSQKYPVSFERENEKVKQTIDFTGKQDSV